jgi:flagellar motility protein MotE (MotC chaperone)
MVASAAPTSTTTQTTGATAAPADKPSDGAGQAQNKGEADVLHALSDRRAELDRRENDLALREQMLAATQKQVDDKIAELKAIQSKLDGMLAQRDDAQKAQLLALVKMYEAMKPDDAAKIFNTLDPRILTEVAGGMKPAKVGPVLAAMDPAKAQALTALLANRLLLPTPQAPVAPTTTPQAQALPTADASTMPTLPGATSIIGAGAGAAAPGFAEPAAPAPAPTQSGG